MTQLLSGIVTEFLSQENQGFTAVTTVNWHAMYSFMRVYSRFFQLLAPEWRNPSWPYATLRALRAASVPTGSAVLMGMCCRIYQTSGSSASRCRRLRSSSSDSWLKPRNSQLSSSRLLSRYLRHCTSKVDDQCPNSVVIKIMLQHALETWLQWHAPSNMMQQTGLKHAGGLAAGSIRPHA